MQVLEITKRELDFKQFTRRSAVESDFDKLITKDTLVTSKGKPIILYKYLTEDTSKIQMAVRQIKYSKETRTQGLKSESRVFGYSPRNTIRKDYCSATALAYEKPKEHNLIANFGSTLAKLYYEYFPTVYDEHSKLVKSKMLPNWVIKDSPFTSGIINKNNPLKYHFDAGNIKGVLSNMVVFKNMVKGGYLSCPEYNIGFEAAHNTVILFDGQSILHGVTPIKKITPTAYRYSIVYYTLEQMWSCLPLNDEMLRVRKKHLERERNRANGGVDLSQLAHSKFKSI